MLGDLLRLIRTEGPLQWELAFQLATSVAAGDEPDANPDPMARIRLEELSAIAELHVADVTGMVLGPGPKLVPTTRVEWAATQPRGLAPAAGPPRQGLTSPPEATGTSGPLGFKPPSKLGADRCRTASADPGPADNDPLDEALPPDPFLGEPDPLLGEEAAGDDDNEEAGLAEMIGRWTSAMAPAMAAMQVGSVVGHLARRSLGRYDLPLPLRIEGDNGRRLQSRPLRRAVEPPPRRPEVVALRP